MNRKVTANAGAGSHALTVLRSTLFHIFHIVTLIPYATACLCLLYTSPSPRDRS